MMAQLSTGQVIGLQRNVGKRTVATDSMLRYGTFFGGSDVITPVLEAWSRVLYEACETKWPSLRSLVRAAVRGV